MKLSYNQLLNGHLNHRTIFFDASIFVELIKYLNYLKMFCLNCIYTLNWEVRAGNYGLSVLIIVADT